MRVGKRFQGLRALFDRQDFRKLCISQIFGGIGEWVATLALIALVWERTHSAVVSGLVLAMRILPAALVGSLLGMLVDRFDRRRVLVACTAVRACIYGSLPLVGGVAVVLALALLAEIATISYMAARDATLPRLVPTEHLATANAISMASAFGSMPFGSAVFAGLAWLQGRSGHPGVGLALVGAAVLLGSATLFIGRIGAAAGIPDEIKKSGPQETARARRTALREILRGDPVLRRVMIGGVVLACSGGTLITLGLSYVRDTLHAGSVAYAVLLTSFCAGAVTGVIALQRARKHLPRIFHSASGLMGVILVGMALFPSTAVGYGMGFLFGAAAVATMLGAITILQDRIHDAVRGRAFAFVHSSVRIVAVGVGLLAAWGAHMLGQGHVLWRMDGTQVMLGGAGLALFIAAVWLVAQIQRAAAQPVAS
jgi:dTMP kinase